MSANAWSSWEKLNQAPWSVFVTCTFPDETSEDRASKAWSYFTNKLSRAVLPCGRAKRSGLPWVRGIEKHENGSAHVHALIGDVDDVSYEAISSLWKEITSGGIIDVQAYDKAKDALLYVTKSGNVDVSLYFNE